MRFLHLCIALCVGGAIASSSLAAQPPTPPANEPARLALVIRFADGRTTGEIVSARNAWMWTPKFPTIASPGPNEQTTLPIVALQVSRKLVGKDVHVDVSLLLKGTNQPKPIESTIVRRGQSVAVEALRQFGIEPIVLTVVDVAPIVTDLPILASAAPELVFEHAEIVTSPYPGYRITVRNVAQQAVALIHLQTYRGDREVMSRLNGGEEGRPLVAPGAPYQFEVHVSTGEIDAGTTLWTPAMLDRIAIDGVLWDDGSAVGDRQFLPPGRARVAGQRIQLARIIAACRAELSADAIGLDRLRMTFESFDVDDPALLRDARDGLQKQRADAVETLRRYMVDSGALHDSQAGRAWIAATMARYAEQLRRLSPP